ncbi:MAG: glutaredoxin 3 [Gammaproteobacteria bacterium]|nr:glutaredoxin 3 [Gammaproteobacteria bacterium]
MTNDETVRVVMYGTAYCPYCVRARGLLDDKGVSYEDIRLENAPELRQEMERRSGRRTVPQIFIGDTHVGGSDDLYALERNGKLDELLRTGVPLKPRGIEHG